MSDVAKWILGTVVTTFTGMAIAATVRANKKLKNAATKKDLEDVLNKSKQYTNEKIQIHEDKQVLEFAAIKQDVAETKEMVTFLYQNALKKQ